MKTLKIGMFGFGCVGTGLFEVINKTKHFPAIIEKIVVKNPNKKRIYNNVSLSFDPDFILRDKNIDVVVELINNSDEAFEIVRAAICTGKHVITANKKLLAENLTELIELARQNNVSLLYEGAVAGSIPIIRNLEEYYNNDSLTRIEGIVNGTTNYILTQANKGVSYQQALKTAQEKGFAEAEPTLDVDGFDAKFKLVILLKHAFGINVKPHEIPNIGIRNIKPQDILIAQEKLWRIKLFAKSIKTEKGVIAYVAPHAINNSHSAFYVDDEFNAVIVEAAFADKQLFYGKGAGSYPTASAVLSDISALQLGYKYEYRKSIDSSLFLNQSDSVRVYVGSTHLDTLNSIEFEEVEDLYIGKEYTYRIGLVHFDVLCQIDWNNRKDLSILFLPEENANNHVKLSYEFLEN
jgi:homoserine dehydrogenase